MHFYLFTDIAKFLSCKHKSILEKEKKACCYFTLISQIHNFLSYIFKVLSLNIYTNYLTWHSEKKSLMNICSYDYKWKLNLKFFVIGQKSTIYIILYHFNSYQKLKQYPVDLIYCSFFHEYVIDSFAWSPLETEKKEKVE